MLQPLQQQPLQLLLPAMQRQVPRRTAASRPRPRRLDRTCQRGIWTRRRLGAVAGGIITWEEVPAQRRQ